MAAESWGGEQPLAIAFVEAHAASLRGEDMVGPDNEDGYQVDTYPLTPLRWKATHTLADAVGDECWACMMGDSTLPPEFNPNLPKPRQFADAGISAVPFSALVPEVRDGSVPVVFWPYGGRLVVGEIPGRHLTAVPAFSEFLWAQRFTGAARFGAGRLYAGRVVVAQAVRAVDVVPAAEIPSTIPAY